MNQNQTKPEAQSIDGTSVSSDKHSHLRLISINKASQIMGIRHESVRRLIDEGRLNAIEIDGKFKVPMGSIEDFVMNLHSQPGLKKFDRRPVANADEKIQKIIKRHS